MEKAFQVNLISYLPILKSYGVKFKEDSKSLMVGRITVDSRFALIISCRTLDTPELLKKILPILKNSRAVYRLVKDQHTQYRLNAGSFGDEEVGKVLTIFPENEDEAISLSITLKHTTETFKGPVVNDAQRIGSIIYIQAVEHNREGNTLLKAPDHLKLPFEIPKAFRQKKRKPKLLGSYYLPIELLRSSPKGNIYKAINLKKLAFDWCFIKQGNPVALDDHFDRDMKDRLLWQKHVLSTLENKVATPRVLDYFQDGDHHYLVLAFAEGESLGRMVRARLAGKQWSELAITFKQELLRWFIEAVNIVKIIHANGYIHRDLTDSNFIILKDNSLCIIDFELSYSTALQEPNPPFLLGTFGYVAPEQIEHAVPDFKEDIYSLGALLCFLLTGCKTWEFITPNRHQLKNKLMRLTGDLDLVVLILKCLSPSRVDRPDLVYLMAAVNNNLSTLNTKINETVTMAL